MKALGKDIQDCWNNHFPENGYYDDDEFSEKHNLMQSDLILEPDKLYNLREFPYIYFDYINGEYKEEVTFESVFKKYYKQYHPSEQTHYKCNIPVDKKSKFLDFCQKNDIGLEEV